MQHWQDRIGGVLESWDNDICFLLQSAPVKSPMIRFCLLKLAQIGLHANRRNRRRPTVERVRPNNWLGGTARQRRGRPTVERVRAERWYQSWSEAGWHPLFEVSSEVHVRLHIHGLRIFLDANRTCLDRDMGVSSHLLIKNCSNALHKRAVLHRLNWSRR